MMAKTTNDIRQMESEICTLKKKQERDMIFLKVVILIILVLIGSAMSWNVFQDSSLGQHTKDITELYNLPSVPKGYTEECFERVTEEGISLTTTGGQEVFMQCSKHSGQETQCNFYPEDRAYKIAAINKTTCVKWHLVRQ